VSKLQQHSKHHTHSKYTRRYPTRVVVLTIVLAQRHGDDGSLTRKTEDSTTASERLGVQRRTTGRVDRQQHTGVTSEKGSTIGVPPELTPNVTGTPGNTIGSTDTPEHTADTAGDTATPPDTTEPHRSAPNHTEPPLD